MARQAPKKYSKMDYLEKQEFNDKMAKKYGVNKDDFNTAQGGGGGRYDFIHQPSYEKAIARAMANDYDTRRSIEAAQDAGSSKAQDLGKGINNIKDAVNAERFMAKTHTKKLGATGKYTSANDEGNVTRYWVDKAQNNFRDSLTAEMASQTEPNEATEVPNAELERSPSFNDVYGKTAKASGGYQSANEAQDLLASSLKSIANDRNAVEGAKLNQGRYVLANLGSSTYEA